MLFNLIFCVSSVQKKVFIDKTTHIHLLKTKVFAIFLFYEE